MSSIDSAALIAVVTEQLAATGLPGAVIGLSQGDATEVYAVGEAGPGQPMTGDAVMRIASLTKPLVAALTLVLAADGVLALDEPVTRWLPELVGQRVLSRPDGPVAATVPADRPPTVEDLLTMRLGFGWLPGTECPVLGLAAAAGLGLGPPDPTSPLTGEDWLGRFAELPLMQQPGTTWMYDVAFGVLGTLLSRAADTGLDDLLHDRLLAPLGMHDTGFAVPEHARDRLVPCYRRGEDGRLEVFDGAGFDGAAQSRWHERPTMPDARGGLVSTAADYLRFAGLLLGHGPELLTPQAVAAMTTDQLTASQRSAPSAAFLSGSGWGYGVEVVESGTDSATAVRRYGWGGGFGTTWYSFPDHDMSAVLLLQCLPPPPGPINAFWAALTPMVAASA